MNCGRELWGGNEHELGACPVFKHTHLDGVHNGTYGGRACWVVAGTLCEGRVQGTFAVKEKDCMVCRFYMLVLREESMNLQKSEELLRKMEEL